MRSSLLVLAALSAVTVLALPRDAEACGGCFVPTETNTVVTDHRMILSVSTTQTTLYDQIRYQGDPASFAWVLPITKEVEVGLSADVVFAALDAMTAVQVFPPPRNCPPPPNCNARSDGNFGASAGAAPPSDGVNVNKRETVGPYETVQLSATDAAALDRWLTNNGFTVPDDVKPVVAQYVAEHFDFLAMKLVPGASVKSMRPVRVTTKGASAVLPLRMVAAGTGPVVGISLWVVGEGRYEPKNFPSFLVEGNELVWDWTTSSSNYKALRDAKTAASNGRAWELESSTSQAIATVKSTVESGGRFFGGGGRPPPGQASDDYQPVTTGGAITKTAEQVREEDLATLFAGIRGSEVRLTRLRADLKHEALAEDLVMTAPVEQGTVATSRQVTKEANQPLCPIFQGCEATGQAPRDEAIAQAQLPGGSLAGKGGCASAARSASGTGGAAALALGGVVLALARRRRARR